MGLQIGTDGIGFYAQASVGQGKAHGNGTTHTDTVVDAADTLTMLAGDNATIQGAQAKGNTVLADIGHDLNVVSEQDTGDYASTQWQVGGKVVVGMGASASGYASYGKVDSHYASVTEASGIQAGAGGYQVHVGDTTHLVGGQLASTADPSRNLLDTGNLIAESVHNESKYSAVSVSVSGGSGGAGFGGGLSMQNHDASSDTQSGLAAGTVMIRNNPGQDLSGVNLAQTTLDANGIKNGFDAQKVAEQQELGSVAGYVGMRAAGDVEQSLSYAPGSTGAVALHTVVGGAVASLSGGNVAQGALGAGAGEYATGVVSDQLAKNGTDPYSAKGKAILSLTSLAAGAAAGGGTGAGASLAGEQYNQQLHPDYVLHLQSEAKTFAEQQCGCDLSSLPPDQQQEAIDNATNTLLQTAQRMQDDTFNAKFNGAPLDAAAQAFIQNDNFGEWTGGKYYDLSQATAAQKADPNINGYALYTQLNSNNNGGIGALMPATGYDLEQYAVLARNDYNSGRPQSQAFDVQFQLWKNQDALSFLEFNGRIALAGAGGGALSSVSLLADAAGANTATGGFLNFMASPTGAAAIGGTVNAGSQYIQTGKINPVNVAVSAATAALGMKGGFWWNMAVNAEGGAVQTVANNAIYGTNDSVMQNALTSAVFSGFGYGMGKITTSGMGYLGTYTSTTDVNEFLPIPGYFQSTSTTFQPLFGGGIPTITGNFSTSFFQELISAEAAKQQSGNGNRTQ